MAESASSGLDSPKSCPSVEGAPSLRRWCNMMYMSKCRLCAVDAEEQCPYMHLDAYVTLDRPSRLALGMPNLMTRHMKALTKEMVRIVNELARLALDEYIVASAWKGRGAEPLSPYLGTVTALRRLGWVIPPAPPAASTTLEHAPYAKDVATILAVAAASLHYNVASSTSIMFDTVAWVLGRQHVVPPLPARGTIGDGLEDMPTLVDTLLLDEEDDAATPRSHNVASPHSTWRTAPPRRDTTKRAAATSRRGVKHRTPCAVPVRALPAPAPQPQPQPPSVHAVASRAPAPAPSMPAMQPVQVVQYMQPAQHVLNHIAPQPQPCPVRYAVPQAAFIPQRTIYVQMAPVCV
eukprot:TRINITY_DN9172_c0_g1_i1.p1 TRINITY_DN9172_c0_g1~~TRINITY_DN9172_c0_g1_i1.p1  ORF type:complete len:371 (+),score=73.91 TRINITY_DN9172_c0_g1_i1:67-1113(+)